MHVRVVSRIETGRHGGAPQPHRRTVLRGFHGPFVAESVAACRRPATLVQNRACQGRGRRRRPRRERAGVRGSAAGHARSRCRPGCRRGAPARRVYTARPGRRPRCRRPTNDRPSSCRAMPSVRRRPCRGSTSGRLGHHRVSGGGQLPAVGARTSIRRRTPRRVAAHPTRRPPATRRRAVRVAETSSTISAMNAAPRRTVPRRFVPRCGVAYAWARRAGPRRSATSSPPTWSVGDGNRSASCADDGLERQARRRHARVEHVVDERLHAGGAAAVGRIPQRRNGDEGGEHCPGRSTSGTMTTPAAAARSTHPAICAGVSEPPYAARTREPSNGGIAMAYRARADAGQRRR